MILRKISSLAGILFFFSFLANPCRAADSLKTSTPAQVKAVQHGSSDEDDLILDEGEATKPAADSTNSKGPAMIPSNTTAQPPAATTAPATPSPDVKHQEATAKLKNPDSVDDLILEGGEEDLLKDNSAKTGSAPVLAPSVAKSPAAQPAPAAQSTAGSGAVPAQSSQMHPPVPGKYTPAAPNAKSPLTPIPAAPAVAAPAKIEQVESINFARNLKDYRSPKLAMLLSLLLPGAGQAYAGNYWKTAVFGAVEVATITAAAVFSVKGNQEKLDAHHFADQHFSADTLQKYYTTITNEANAGQDSNGLAVIQSLQPDSSFYAEAHSKSTNFYNDLQGKPYYVQGWDDCTPRYQDITNATPGQIVDSTGTVKYAVDDSSDYFFFVNRIVNGVTTGTELMGYSPNQNKYDDMMSRSNLLYRDADAMFYVLIVNHIVSAIDAGITAKAHNDQLLSKESFWRHVDIEQRMVYTGSEEVPGVALEVKF